ncbi:antibiotic biosynthesis monooxygenase family protein [Thermostaphylospora chromogena]|uniref:Heme-degrading monooxygenase HmoA n=1 Tax=Thermostaphylospora chromogena TaxID=35622 RepID=A0A1H1A9B5_9ACTN|nr:antibiotic biosynthesis monooxygenase [Thermostaphylospora chromogena]SDQ35906.1 Heme-degrading monooxygenase HmoA [Thermostaphylospora chromogena]
MSRRVRVLVYVRLPDGDPDGVTRAYHRVSRELAGTAGLLGNELLRSVHDPREFAVLSEWESMAAFRAWERTAAHRRTTAPLRPYQDRTRGPGFAVYAVEAAYPKETDQ